MWAICIHHISSLNIPGLVGWTKKVHVSFKKNPPVEFSGYGPEHIATLSVKHSNDTCVIITSNCR